MPGLTHIAHHELTDVVLLAQQALILVARILLEALVANAAFFNVPIALLKTTHRAELSLTHATLSAVLAIPCARRLLIVTASDMTRLVAHTTAEHTLPASLTVLTYLTVLALPWESLGNTIIDWCVVATTVHHPVATHTFKNFVTLFRHDLLVAFEASLGLAL